VIHHWRSHGGAEVDIVLERDRVLYPIEVKATSRPSRCDSMAMTVFRRSQAARVAPGLVIAPTDAILRLSEDTYALPWDLGPVHA
jgi:predicted AAA+ superfamily ATPase